MTGTVKCPVSAGSKFSFPAPIEKAQLRLPSFSRCPSLSRRHPCGLYLSSIVWVKVRPLPLLARLVGDSAVSLVVSGRCLEWSLMTRDVTSRLLVQGLAGTVRISATLRREAHCAMLGRM